MADQFDPTQFGAVAVEDEPFDPEKFGAVPVQQERPGFGEIVSRAGEAALNVGKGLVQAVFHKPSLSEIAGIALGPVGVATHGLIEQVRGVPETIHQVQEAEETPAWSKERFAAGFNVVSQLGMLAAGEPAVRGFKYLKPKLAEVAGIAKPKVTEPDIPEPAAAEQAAADPIVTPPNEPTGIGQTRIEPSELHTQGQNLEGQFAELQRQAADLQERIDAQRGVVAEPIAQPVPSAEAPTTVQHLPKTTPEGGEISASEITSTEGAPVREVREEVGGEAPLRQQGIAPEARQEVQYTPEQTQALAEAQARRESALRNADNWEKIQGDKFQADKQRKAAGFRYAAEVRQITGNLTAKEAAAVAKREASNYIGKDVTVNGRPAKVVSTPFGKVRVQFEDGTKQSFNAEKITPVPKAETPPTAPLSPKTTEVVGQGEAVTLNPEQLRQELGSIKRDMTQRDMPDTEWDASLARIKELEQQLEGIEGKTVTSVSSEIGKRISNAGGEAWYDPETGAVYTSHLAPDGRTMAILHTEKTSQADASGFESAKSRLVKLRQDGDSFRTEPVKLSEPTVPQPEQIPAAETPQLAAEPPPPGAGARPTTIIPEHPKMPVDRSIQTAVDWMEANHPELMQHIDRVKVATGEDLRSMRTSGKYAGGQLRVYPDGTREVVLPTTLRSVHDVVKLLGEEAYHAESSKLRSEEWNAAAATKTPKEYQASIEEQKASAFGADVRDRFSRETVAREDALRTAPSRQAVEPPPPGAGAPLPQKTSKIGQSIEAKAVEAKLTQGFAETAGYDPVSVAGQSKMATDLVRDNLPLSRAMVRGEAPLPPKLQGVSLITAMEEHLVRNPDARTAYELANSPLTSETSVHAQAMRLMRERIPDSLEAKFTEIKTARREGAKLRGETPEKVVVDIAKEVTKQASKRPTWEAFVRDIVCPV